MANERNREHESTRGKSRKSSAVLIIFVVLGWSIVFSNWPKRPCWWRTCCWSRTKQRLAAITSIMKADEDKTEQQTSKDPNYNYGHVLNWSFAISSPPKMKKIFRMWCWALQQAVSMFSAHQASWHMQPKPHRTNTRCKPNSLHQRHRSGGDMTNPVNEQWNQYSIVFIIIHQIFPLARNWWNRNTWPKNVRSGNCSLLGTDNNILGNYPCIFPRPK